MFDRRQQLAAARGLIHLTANGFTQLGMSHDGPQDSCFDAFSSREPAPMSLENARRYDSLPTDFSSSSQA
jgi:hypothetical protein